MCAVHNRCHFSPKMTPNHVVCGTQWSCVSRVERSPATIKSRKTSPIPSPSRVEFNACLELCSPGNSVMCYPGTNVVSAHRHPAHPASVRADFFCFVQQLLSSSYSSRHLPQVVFVLIMQFYRRVFSPQISAFFFAQFFNLPIFPDFFSKVREI